MLICETFYSQRMFTETSFSSVLNQILVKCNSICLIILPVGFYIGSSGYCKNLSIETVIETNSPIYFVSCLLSHPNSFGSFSSSISFLRKQHYMHPSNKLPVLCFNRLWRWTNIVSWIYGVMAILCFERITITVIKYKLIIRNRLWNTVAVTQESFQNSSLGKISVFFRVEGK